MHSSFTALFAAILLGGALPAMGQISSPTSQQPTDGKPAERATLTGCLRDTRVGSSDAALPAATADSHGGTPYVLEVPLPGTTAGTADSTPATPPRANPSTAGVVDGKATYRLVTKDASELAKHVNHLVEITGTRATHAGLTAAPGTSTAGSTTPGTTSPGVTTTPAERPGMADPRNPQPPSGSMIEIITLRMVSANCTGS